jgi:TonB family protein
MLNGLLLIAAAFATSGTASPDQSVQTKNGEFIFSQYPPRALAAGEQGSVRFRAEVDAKGNVLACKVTATSGYKRLDSETCDLIVDHATFAPTLDSEGKTRAAVHDGIVNWRIPGLAADGTQIASGPSPDQIICKRQTKTGSLVSHSRLCMTRKQWVAYAEHNQDEWGSMQGRQGSSREDQATWTSGQ